MKPWRFWIGLALASLVVASPALAQTTEGSVAGRVLDSAGAAVPGAKVTLKSTDGGTVHTSTADAAGAYLQEHLPPGDYEVQAEGTGFGSGTVASVRVSADARTTLDLRLEAPEAPIPAESAPAEPGTPPASPAEPAREPLELGSYFTELRGAGLFDPGAADRAERELASMSPQERSTLQQAMAQVPELRALPKVLAGMRSAEASLAQLVQAQRELDVAKIELARIQQLSGSPEAQTELEVAKVNLVNRLASIKRRLEPLEASGPDSAVRQPDPRPRFTVFSIFGCNLDCSAHLDIPPVTCNAQAFFNCAGAKLTEALQGVINTLEAQINSLKNAILGQISSLVNAVTGIASQIQTTFTNLFDLIKNELTAFLRQILALIPASAQDLVAKLGLTGDWWVALGQPSQAGAVALCPPQGFDLPGMGIVGSLQAEWLCGRGIDWAAGALFDLAPSDSEEFGMALKIAAFLLRLPISYLCTCLDVQEDLKRVADRKRHRDFMTPKLDVELSTRATELSAQALEVSLSDLNANLGLRELELGQLIAKADGLRADQGGQSEALGAFREQVLRINIEENLAGGHDAVLLFQIPRDKGGHLERVREIVADTIQKNLAANLSVGYALEELAEGDEAFSAGEFELAFRKYQDAYRAAVKKGH